MCAISRNSACRLGYWTYGGPPEQDPFGGADAAERAACLRFMRLTAAEVLDWLHKQHVPNATERRRRERLQQVLDTRGEQYSADELPVIAAYRRLPDYALIGDKQAHNVAVKRKRWYQVEVTVADATAHSAAADTVDLSDGLLLRFKQRAHGGHRLFMYFAEVEAAVLARDEVYFAIYGLCAPLASESRRGPLGVLQHAVAQLLQMHLSAPAHTLGPCSSQATDLFAPWRLHAAAALSRRLCTQRVKHVCSALTWLGHAGVHG